MFIAFPIAKPHIARNLGFTLVEMLVVIAIIGTATALGLPSYREWVLNAQIRNAAESIQNGLQRTRAEAVARNTDVAFILKGVSPTWDSSWDIQVVKTGVKLDSRLANEGSKKATCIATPKNATPLTTTLTFNSLGRVTTNVPASASITQIDCDLPTTLLSAADSRDLRVTISTGGSVRMCDPNLTAGSSPQAC